MSLDSPDDLIPFERVLECRSDSTASLPRRVTS